MKRAAAATVIGVMLVAVARGAQAPSSSPAQAFEVASVKPNKSGDGRVMIGMPSARRFTVTNVPLGEIIRFAYQVQSFQMIGAPDWTGSERFDIVATADRDLGSGDALPILEPGAQPPLGCLMLRSLLADRFKLAVHTETRDLQTYALVVARDDKTLGPQIRVSETDCAALIAAARASGGPPLSPRPGEPPKCGIYGGAGSLMAGSMPLSQLAGILSQRMGRLVLDHLGLTGNFDFTLTYTPDQLPPRAPGTASDQPVRVDGIDIDPNGPSLMTALQEQLGLRLESARAPVEVLVIDHVERPTPD